MKRRSFLSCASLLGLPFVAATRASSDHRSPDIDQYSGIANVRQFGAVGNGTKDDSAAIQAAVDAAQVVFFPPGNYLVRRKIDLRSGASLIGDGGATLRTDGTSYILSAIGRIGSRFKLRRDARRGDRSIHTSASSGNSFRAGAGFHLQSNSLPLGHPSHRAGELGTITAVSSNEVQAYGLVLDDYLVADEALIAPVDFIEGISIRGLTLSNDNYGADPVKITSALVYLEFVRDFAVTGCRLQRNNSAGIAVFNCLDGRISDNTICELADAPGGILGYGVQIGFSSRCISVTGNNFRRCRHAVTTGTGSKSSRTPNYGVSRNLAITGNTIENCSNSGLDTHEDSDGVTISGNSILGCDAVGVHVRSYRSSISANSISSCTRIGIRVSKAARDTIISSNIIDGIMEGASSGDGISIEAPAATLSGNRITNCDRHGIALIGEASADISLVGNSCIGNGRLRRGYGIYVGASGPISGLTIVGNTCFDAVSSGTQRAAFSVNSATDISGNDNLVANNNFQSPGII